MSRKRANACFMPRNGKRPGVTPGPFRCLGAPYVNPVLKGKMTWYPVVYQNVRHTTWYFRIATYAGSNAVTIQQKLPHVGPRPYTFHEPYRV